MELNEKSGMQAVGCPMDRHWASASSLDKKVDRKTYGGATVQAMDKNGIKGFNEA